MWKPLLLAALFSTVLQGCLYTSHHFNSGRVLEPGNTAITFGWGNFKIYEESCGDGGNIPDVDESGKSYCTTFLQTGDTVMRNPSIRAVTLPKFSLGYRLGVRREWGPFTGMELGWHLEVPTNPGSVEFDVKFGLPAPARYFHSLSGGWIVGSWADNSLFTEYAASRAIGAGDPSHVLYASYRLTYLATQPDEAVQTDTLVNRFDHHRRFAHQASAGFNFRMPAIPVLPDFVTPQVTVSMPVVPAFDGPKPDVPYLLNFNFGIGWRF